MKIVLDVKVNGQLKENDILVFRNGCWTAISKESFLAKVVSEQKMKNEKYEEEISKLHSDLVSLAKIVKEK